MRLKDKRAVVTGAAGDGIGRAIVERFRSEGAEVAVIDIRSPEAPLPGTHYIKADVSEPTQLSEALEEAERLVGDLDTMVNAVGVTHRKPFLELSLDEWDTVHRVNVRPIFTAIQWVARRIILRGGGGTVTNIASINGSFASVGQAHYSAAKAGVIMLSRAAAVELAPHGIRVNSISPGTVETDMNRHLLATEEFRALRRNPIPLGRIGVPEDVAPMAVLLASDEGSFFTACDIVIDGGQTAW